MNEPTQTAKGKLGGIGTVTLVSAALVVVLALGALLWPRGAERTHAHNLLVYDSSGSEVRVGGVFTALREYLVEAGGGPLHLVVARTVAEFRTLLAEQPDYVFGPDGLALSAPAAQYLPLVVGRRNAPRNLRPRGVLVSRLSAGEVKQPWLSHPTRTVFGDSVSLVAAGILRADGGMVWPRGYVCGPDPYDHGPVLHALRLGGFDFAVVRQWDADRFFTDGLLASDQFVMRNLVAPVPDVVLLVSRKLSTRVRLECGEGLSALGRQQEDETPWERGLRLALADLSLVGFNLLLEPDFELVRKNYDQDWLPGTD